MDNYFVIYAVIIFFVHYCVCDYDCLCNYNVEKVVYESADASGKLIGYLYEFDCKPLISAADPNWATIAFEHKLGFVEKDDKIQTQICPGTVPDEDILFTTQQTILPTTMAAEVTSTTQPKPPTTTEIKQTTSSPLTQSAPPMVLSTDIISSSVPSPTAVSSPLFSLTSTQMSTNLTISLLSQSTTSSKTTPTFPSLSPVSKQATDLPSSTTSTLNLQNNTLSGTPNNNVYTPLSPLSNTTVQSITATVTSDQTFANLSHKSTSLISVASTASNGDLNNNNITSVPYTSMSIPPEKSIISQSLSSTLKTIHTTSTSAEQSTYISPMVSLATTIQSPTTLSETAPFITASSKPGIFADRVDLCPYQYLALSKYNSETGIYPTFRQYGKYCFELRLERKDWFEAQLDCRTRGGNLAEIADSETQGRIYDMITTAVKGYKPDIWIGLNDLKREGQWEWVDGHPLTKESFVKEVHGDAIYSDLRDCFLMDGNNGYWKNTACRTFLLDTQLHPWVCQYKIL